MKITFHGEYISKKGNATFRYVVDGTQEELKEYKEIQGENYVFDESLKKPLYFSIERFDKPMNLLKNHDGTKFYVDKPLLEKKIQDKVDTWKALAHLTGKSVEELIAGALGV